MIRIKKVNFTSCFIIYPILASTLFLFSCTEKRPKEYIQGYGENYISNLHKISQFDNKVFSLQTGATMFTSHPTSAQQITKADQNQKTKDFHHKDYDLVKYKTKAPFFKDISFRGHSHTQDKYFLKYVLTENPSMLKIYKLVHDKSLLSSTELTYAEEVDQNVFLVPLVAYPITYYYDEAQQNAYGEDTYKIVQFTTTSKAKATSFQIHLANKRLFQSITKADVYPMEMFQGDWFYTETIINKSVYTPIFLGLTGYNVDNYKQFASRTKFNLNNKDFLKLVNVNIPSNLSEAQKIEETDFHVTLTIPIQRVDFRLDPNDNAKMTEQITTENTPNSKPWNEKRYVKVQFEQIISETLKDFFQRPGNIYAEFKNLEISDNYFAVTLNYPEGLTIKHAFRRAHPPKTNQIRNYFKSDHEKFGFFKTVVPSITDYTIRYKKDIEQNFYINKHMPENNILEVRFTNNTPIKYRDTIEESFNEYKVFFDRETNIDLVLKKDPKYDVTLGDNRYHTINIIDKKNMSSYLGYAPTIKDPLSGEIISGNVNVYLHTIEKSLYSYLSNFVLHKLERFKYIFDEKYIVNKHAGYYSKNGKNYLGIDPLTTVSSVITSFVVTPSIELNHYDDEGAKNRSKLFRSQSSQQGENKYVHDYEPGVDPIIDFYKKYEKNYNIHANDSIKEINAEAHQLYLYARDHYLSNNSDDYSSSSLSSSDNVNNLPFSFQISNDYYEDMFDYCPSLEKYITTLKEANKFTNENERDVFEACIAKLIPNQLKQNFIHEFGHFLSLTHNFKASTDKENFNSVDDNYGQPVHSSSVMEYPARNINLPLKPGKYDIAALRFLYTNKIELNTSSDPSAIQTKLYTIDTQKSIEDNVKIAQKEFSNKDLSLHNYKFCSDFHLSRDPLCNRFDNGTTPLEIVNNYIALFNSEFANLHLRYDRERYYQEESEIQQILFKYFHRSIFNPLQKIYGYWRLQLSYFQKENEIYFQNFDEDKYNEMINDLKKFSYQEIRIGKMHNSKLDFFRNYYPAVEKIMKFTQDLITLPNQYCVVKDYKQDEQIKFIEFNVLQEEIFAYKGVTIKNCNEAFFVSEEFVNEIGFPIRNLKYDLNTYLNRTPFDVIGTNAIRLGAMLLAVSRFPELSTLKDKRFFPNMLDNPLFRKNIKLYLVDRIINGVTLDIDKKKYDFDYILKNREALISENSKYNRNNDYDLLNLSSYYNNNYYDNNKFNNESASENSNYLSFNFTEEKRLLKDFSYLFFLGLMIFNENEESIKRFAPFEIFVYPRYAYKEFTNQPNLDIKTSSIVAHNDANIASNIIIKYNILNDIEKSLFCPEIVNVTSYEDYDLFIERMKDFFNYTENENSEMRNRLIIYKSRDEITLKDLKEYVVKNIDKNKNTLQAIAMREDNKNLIAYLDSLLFQSIILIGSENTRKNLLNSYKIGDHIGEDIDFIKRIPKIFKLKSFLEPEIQLVELFKENANSILTILKKQIAEGKISLPKKEEKEEEELREILEANTISPIERSGLRGSRGLIAVREAEMPTVLKSEISDVQDKEREEKEEEEILSEYVTTFLSEDEAGKQASQLLLNIPIKELFDNEEIRKNLNLDKILADLNLSIDNFITNKEELEKRVEKYYKENLEKYSVYEHLCREENLTNEELSNQKDLLKGFLRTAITFFP